MHEPEYYSTKGIALLRVGGLSPVWQNNSKAPENRGLWAFIFPHFDWWFMSGKMSADKFPKKKVEKHLYPKPRKFFAEGILYTRIMVPGSEEVNGWNKTTAKELYQYLPKVFARDIKLLHSSERDFAREHYKFYMIRHPYAGNGFMGSDHMEVFVPSKTKIH